jgi:hypothetical protein
MDRVPNGSTLLKWRQLEQLGYAVVSIPYWEWDALCKQRQNKDAFFRERIRAPLVARAPAFHTESNG